jgi:DinB superfamily
MQTAAADLLETLEQTLPLLSQISETEASVKPAPHKWSKKEILGHLIDSACNNQQKFIRTALAEGHFDFVGYQQDHWVALQHYQEAPWSQILDLWAAYNRHLAHLIARLPADKLANTISIEGVGPFTLGFIAADYVQHLKHHLRAVLPEAGLSSTFSNVYHA